MGIGSEALAAMNSALRRKAVELQKLLADTAVAEVDGRYKISTIIRDVQDAEGTYGERAVERLASALGHDDATLYRYVAVARAWSASEMRALSRRTNRFGEPLSWSHWVALARLSDWKPWLERTLSEGWSARKLRGQLKAERQRLRSPRTLGPDETTSAALLESTKDVDRWNVQLTSYLKPIVDRLVQSPSRSAQLERQMARLRDSLAETSRRVDELRKCLPEPSPAKAVRRAVAQADRGVHNGMLIAGGTPQVAARHG
jgi:hypothetical protein